MKSRRTLIFISIAIGVAIIAAVAAYFISQMQNKQSNQSTEQAISQAEDSAVDADKVAYEGSVSDGVKAYDDAISKTDDKEALFTLYGRKATLLYNDGQFDAALEAAKKSYNLKQVPSSASFVGQIARDKGDKPMAIEYYKKALDLIDPNAPLASEDADYYKAVIAEMEAEE